MTVLRPDWPGPPRLRSAFTLRAGGVSAAPYRALNLAAHVGDEAAAVAENRRRLRAELALPAEPLWLAQVHGTEVLEADRHSAGTAADAAACPPAAAPCADAAITRRAGCVLAVLVADCLPVLIARRDGAAVAVAHAGWRGLAAGVLESTVAAFGCPGDALQAWLGPAIGAAHFEVGAEVRAAFCAGQAQAEAAFAANARGRWQCDLRQLADLRLRALGVASIHGEPRCTFAEPESFYSFRRDGVTGRMAALAWIAERDDAAPIGSLKGMS